MWWNPNSRRALEGKPFTRQLVLIGAGALAVLAILIPLKMGLGAHTNVIVKDPGVRTGPPNAGGRFTNGLTPSDVTYFTDGQTEFNTVYAVPQGLGPRFSENQCASCHAQPAAGGGAPGTNPVFSVYQLSGATNTMPTFEPSTGPVLVPRFPFMSDLVTPDGTVHQLFTITGRSDAQTCSIQQPNFASNMGTSPPNIAYRQPLPIFGDGLLELYDNSTLTANMSAVCAQTQFGVCGTPSISGNDGSLNRLGWKGQWRGINLAAAEEYNTEMGVTNEFFPTEQDQTTGCQLNPIPESATNFNATVPDQYPGGPTRVSLFLRFLAGPAPVTFNAAAKNGQQQFINIGCATCHTFPLTNSAMVTPTSSVAALSQQSPLAYTDLLLHHMGPCLADNVIQGTAQGDMFRTPPLWGDGKRIFFMHDGRTTDLLAAIQDHFCAGNSQYPASEANTVINNYNALTPQNQLNILQFIRDL